ncbi:MAG TPA: LURP-one-related family protein [Methylomirabilota bacterium]|nr:LURP-one-related family protein [Methylomirabilota bacterium]
MRYLMKEKWLALGNDFQILDEHGNQQYFVDGRAFSIGQKLSFRDNHGAELLFIRQRLLSWGPTFEILRGDQTLAVVKKKLFTLLRARFFVDVPGPDDLEAQGDFLNHEYTFSMHGKTVATVTKQWISWTDTYGIDIAPGEDDILILACAVVIDLVLHEPKNH